MLFPLEDYAWIYAGFTLFVVVVLAIDLNVFHRRAHTVSLREAASWTCVWIALALATNVAFYIFALERLSADARLLAIPGFDPVGAARESALEFLAGYLVEKALAADNIFVFAMVFRYLGIPGRYQHRVLYYGILGALVFRAVFISLGAVLLRSHAIVVIAGIFLIYTGVRMALVEEPERDPGQNPLVRLVRRLLPISDTLHDDRFVLRVDGRLVGTPLLVALVVIEGSDIVFAIDSVPAIFGITREPLIVYVSNILAILGLRSMYFMLADALERFHLVKYGVAAILCSSGSRWRGSTPSSMASSRSRGPSG